MKDTCIPPSGREICDVNFDNTNFEACKPIKQVNIGSGVSGPSLFLEIEVWSRRQELKSRSEARDIFDRTVQKADKPLTKAQVIALSRRRSDHEQEIERVRDRKRKLG